MPPVLIMATVQSDSFLLSGVHGIGRGCSILIQDLIMRLVMPLR